MTAIDYRRTQTVKLASWIYGDDGLPPLDDPAETYHEASKLHPSTAGRDAAGVRRLELSELLQLSTVRGIKRHLHRPSLTLPPPHLPLVSLADAVRARRSGRSFGDGDLRLGDLATVLHTAYGVTHSAVRPDGSPGEPLRAVPSGGALYPLELYVLAQRVAGTPRGLYHYDPWRHVLECLPRGADWSAAELTAYPELLEPAAALVLVTAMFWRTRFKYALRGYRFALLEAGHLGQNVVLAAAALQLAALPVGGVFDARAEAVLGIDGVDESLVYLFALGPEPE